LFFFAAPILVDINLAKRSESQSNLDLNQLSNKLKKTGVMRKLKLFILGIGLAGMAGFGISYLGASEVEAQGSNFECEWNGEHCKNPTKTNMCGCESGGVGNQ
jgi:hypothetical protein